MNYCTNCGQKNPGTGRFCTNCGKAFTETPQTGIGTSSGDSTLYDPPIENHLTKAILTTIFCCLPFGIVSIVFASQVNSKLSTGDFDGALQSSDKANMWGNISIGVGIILMALLWIAEL
jgi:uncharacterized membrane protein YvbJ